MSAARLVHLLIHKVKWLADSYAATVWQQHPFQDLRPELTFWYQKVLGFIGACSFLIANLYL